MSCFINFSDRVGADKPVSTTAQDHLQCVLHFYESSSSGLGLSSPSYLLFLSFGICLTVMVHLYWVEVEILRCRPLFPSVTGRQRSIADVTSKGLK